MARVKKAAETSEEFAKSIKKWLGIERATISITKKMLQKVENPIVAAMMDTILRDSEKHKEILSLILEGLESVTVMTREDMGLLAEYIEKHAETEKTIVEMAEQVVKNVRTPIPKFLLEYLLVDEKKHDMIMDGLSVIRSKMPSS
jgi:rubrerythrin